MSGQNHLKIYDLIIVVRLSFLMQMILSLEFLDHDPCVLRRELIGFSLKEGDDWTAENSDSDFNSTLGLPAERKILFQHDTVLDRHMVSVYTIQVSSKIRALLNSLYSVLSKYM